MGSGHLSAHLVGYMQLVLEVLICKVPLERRRGDDGEEMLAFKKRGSLVA